MRQIFKSIALSGERFIEGVVRVDLSSIIDGDLESFLDLLSEKLVDSTRLMDISYQPVGVNGSTILIRVSGDVSAFLEEDE